MRLGNFVFLGDSIVIFVVLATKKPCSISLVAEVYGRTVICIVIYNASIMISHTLHASMGTAAESSTAWECRSVTAQSMYSIELEFYTNSILHGLLASIVRTATTVTDHKACIINNYANVCDWRY